MTCRIALGVMIGLVVTGCSHDPAPRTSVAPSAAFREHVRPYVGCYTLTFGPWQPAEDRLAPVIDSDRPEFLPPSVVRLDTVAVEGHIRVFPPPPLASGFGAGFWNVTADTLSLHWPKVGWFATTFSLDLVAHGDSFQGRASMGSDMRYARPYRSADARRVPCTG
jgi:hypothetical protein